MAAGGISFRTDVRCGGYSAITAFDPADVTEAAARIAVRRLYGSEWVGASGKSRGIWRVVPLTDEAVELKVWNGLAVGRVVVP